jgi:hypothetical protein
VTFHGISGIVEGLESGNTYREEDVIRVQSKLLSLSSSQPRYVKFHYILQLRYALDAYLILTSFGSTVGAPIVFFVGAFIYNMVDIQTRYGDNDTAHALAFGMCTANLTPMPSNPACANV